MTNDRKQPSEFARSSQSADLTPMLRTLLDGRTLSVEETTSAFEAMMTGNVHHGEMGALLALLATRLPTPDELQGAAMVMRRHVTKVESSLAADDIAARVHLTQLAELQREPGGPWYWLEARQTIATGEPGFVWEGWRPFCGTTKVRVVDTETGEAIAGQLTMVDLASSEAAAKGPPRGGDDEYDLDGSDSVGDSGSDACGLSGGRSCDGRRTAGVLQEA